MTAVIHGILVILVIAFWFAVLGKFLHQKVMREKTVFAKVVDKYCSEKASHYPGVGQAEQYTIVFQAKDKRLAFFVSKVTYRNYQKNQTGSLTYRGRKLIDFH